MGIKTIYRLLPSKQNIKKNRKARSMNDSRGIYKYDKQERACYRH